MNELALFAGAGGGILGGKLLGWRTVCAVEWEQYPACVLAARQNDGLLESFPIWDDVQTFDGTAWRGIVDVISGGFPCQDISSAGTGGALLEAEVQCGNTWQGLLAKYNPSTHSLKTAQCSLVEDLNPSCVTLPKWGSMRNGGVFQRQISEQTMNEREFGSLLPTPTCHNSKEGAYPAEYTRRTPSLATHIGGKIHPMFTEWMMGWPLGWTDLKPLETDKYLKWRQLHGTY